MAVKLALNVDSMLLGGAAVQNVGTDLRSDGTTWTVDRLELRAPGFTQIKVDGRLYPLGKSLGFAGGASVDSNDPKNLMTWLSGRATSAAQFKPWHAKGDVTLRADRIAVERLRTEIDRGVGRRQPVLRVAGRRSPARVEGELRAAELDIDGIIGFGESALSGLGLERPGEISLAMDIGRAKIAGFDARNIATRLKLDASGLAIERLSVGDLGDTSFVATGRIQTQSPPGGSITINLDSRDLNGVAALTEKFAPALAGPLRKIAARQKTAALQASVRMESSGADGASGKIGLTGKIGAIRVNVTASATGKREAFLVTDLGALAGADVRADGQFEADAPGPLLGLLGLDRLSGPSRSRHVSTCQRTDRWAANSALKASLPPGRSTPAAAARCGLRPISRRRSISIGSPERLATARCRGGARSALTTCRGSTDRSRRKRSMRGGDCGGDRNAGKARERGRVVHRTDRLECGRSQRPHRLQHATRRVRAVAGRAASVRRGAAERFGSRVRGRGGRIQQGPPGRQARCFERCRRSHSAALARYHRGRAWHDLRQRRTAGDVRPPDA